MSDLFPGAPRMVTIETQIRAAEREHKMRVRVYPNLILNGKMSGDFAADQIDAMAAIVETLKRLKERGEIATRIAGS